MDTLIQAKLIVATTGCSLEQAQQQIALKEQRRLTRTADIEAFKKTMQKSIQNFKNKG